MQKKISDLNPNKSNSDDKTEGGIHNINKSPKRENIEKFIKFFIGDNPDFNTLFSKYGLDHEQPYTSLDVFNKIYESRCSYAHDEVGYKADKLDYQRLECYRPALYAFMDDIIKILDLPSW